jgi:hypothetical protein
MEIMLPKKLTTPLRWAKSKLVGPDLESDLRRARQIADLLDTKFELAGMRFGLEAVLGLVPVVGDTLGAVAGLYPLWVANRHKLGKGVQARMAANLAIEWGGGLIPYVGDFFDVAFKANIRNFKLLESAATRGRVAAA